MENQLCIFKKDLEDRRRELEFGKNDMLGCDRDVWRLDDEVKDEKIRLRKQEAAYRDRVKEYDEACDRLNGHGREIDRQERAYKGLMETDF